LIIAAPAEEDWSEEQLQAAEDAAAGWAPAEYAYDDAHEGYDHEGHDHEVEHGHHELSEEELAEEEVLRQGQDPFCADGDCAFRWKMSPANRQCPAEEDKLSAEALACLATRRYGGKASTPDHSMGGSSGICLHHLAR